MDSCFAAASQSNARPLSSFPCDMLFFQAAQLYGVPDRSHGGKQGKNRAEYADWDIRRSRVIRVQNKFRTVFRHSFSRKRFVDSARLEILEN